MMAERRPLRQRRVPASRVERLLRLGWMTGEAVAGVALRSLGLERTPGELGSTWTVARAERLARRLAGLRGAAMKVAQLLSLQGEGWLPPPLVDALARLRAGADAMPERQLRALLSRAWGRGWPSRFREFDLQPIAAASIGQVHRAILADGTPIAVKVQYPGVARSTDADLRNVVSLLRVFGGLPHGIDLSEFLAEVRQQLRRETDYRIEAAAQSRYRALLATDPDYFVPVILPEWSTSHVLAMDFVHGLPLDDARVQALPPAVRNQIGTRLFRLVFREMFHFHFLQSDPNFANYLWVPETEQLALLDFGACRDIPPRLARLYGDLLRAGAEGHRQHLRRIVREVGLASSQAPAGTVDSLVDLLLLGCEPFRCRGAFDCASSSLPEAARHASFLLLRGGGMARVPSPDTLFLQRKLAGTFLLCAHLKAHVPLRDVLEETLVTDLS